jgi:hypothetical protein
VTAATRQGHLSSLALDRLAARPVEAGAHPHLEACQECRGRLEERAREHAALVGRERFAATLGGIAAEVSAAPRPSRPGAGLRWAGALVGLAGAAALLLLVRPASDGGLRAKGGVTFLLTTPDGAPLPGPRVGQQARLRLTAGDYTHALAVAAGPDGRLTQLWPPGVAGSGRVEGGQRVAVPLLITPGAVTLRALFSAHPLTLAQAQEGPLPPDVEVRTLSLEPLQ